MRRAWVEVTLPIAYDHDGDQREELTANAVFEPCPKYGVNMPLCPQIWDGGTLWTNWNLFELTEAQEEEIMVALYAAGRAALSVEAAS
jgi:hypothetical protein